jgi:two-component system phosphate regulon sensor histidine kinase PhoR
MLGKGARLLAVAFMLALVSMAVIQALVTRRFDRGLELLGERELLAKATHIATELSLAGQADANAGAQDAPRVLPELERRRWQPRVSKLAQLSHTHVTLWDNTGRLVGDSAPEALVGSAGASTPPAVGGETAVIPENSAERRASIRHDVELPVSLGGGSTGTVRVASVLAQGDIAATAGGLDFVSVFLLALLMAAGMAAVASLLSARTARTLTGVATRIAEGDLEARAHISGNDELARLGRALDRLAENLRSTLSELRSERDRQDDILSGMQEGVLLLNRERRVAHVNPALRNLLALSADVVGRLPIEIIRNASLTELLNQAYEAGTPLSREIELSGPAAARVLVRIAPLGGPRGGLLAVFVDVTNLRHLEAVRREFVANASHELRTPIASIHSAAETLVGGVASDPVTRERFLGIIARNATRLKNLVDDLLDLSKLESRTFNVPLRPTLVAAVVRSTFNALGEAADKKQIRLVQRVDPALEAQADPQALEHVLTNLVENAIRYCPSGSEVTISTELSGTSMRLLVADNGPGIPEEHLSRLFERFYRVDAGRSRELGGTGLGLAIVKHWVEVMNGEVGVSSRPGHGSTFSVSLGVSQQ